MKKLLLVCLAGTLFFGCAKEELTELPVQDNESYAPLDALGVTVQNNRLHFESAESFQAFVDELSNADPRAVIDWKRQINYTSMGDTYFGDAAYITNQPIALDNPVVENDYFVSFNPVPTFMPSTLTNYDQADDIGIESYESGDQLPELKESLVVDPILSTVINSNGEVGIDNFIVKVAESHTIITPIPQPDPYPSPTDPTDPSDPTMQPIMMNQRVQDRFAQALDIAKNSRVKFGDEFVEVEENLFVFKHHSTFIGSEENANIGSLFGPNKTGTYQYNSNPRRRTKGRLYSQNYGIYAIIGCSTRNQRRRWRIWWRSNADNISLSWRNVSYEFKDINSVPFIVNEPNGSLTRTNTGRISKVFAVNTGTFSIPIGGGKFKIKSAKSFKVKTFETTHTSSRAGRSGNVSLKY
ncbi:hypothetical protein AB9P05_13870 [Roseivirga sp. BDSF3-8]|uniref:hypothetical protein n=1 Tax=Roseivirga sp. BDSF3-8 TaxID=3241598 RepID=UPI003531E6E4